MSWKEFILTDEFRKYRKRQAQEVAVKVHQMVGDAINGSANPEYMNGSLDMAFRLMRLPGNLIGDEKLQQQLQDELKKDLGELTSSLLRKKLG